jgi:hypothetical protein
MNDEGLADAAAASPFVYPDFTQEWFGGLATQHLLLAILEH